MSLDGAFLHIVKTELINKNLIGAKADKIHQPSRDEIVITLRAAGVNERLLLSAAADSARVTLTRTAPENPQTPPMFCTLLRKHIGNGRLLNITQDGLERIIGFDFRCTTEIGDTVTNRLVVEIMGRRSNIILVNADTGRIIDSVKRVTDDVSSVRRVLPGVPYQSPPRDKRLCLLESGGEEVAEALDAYAEERLHKALLKVCEGISPVFARECAYYCGRDTDIAVSAVLGDKTRRDKLLFFLNRARTALNENKPDIILISEKSGKPKDFCFVNIEQYGAEMVTKRIDSATALLDKFYGAKAESERLRQRAGSLMKTLLNAYERIQRKLDAQRQEFSECAKRGRLKMCGDLINANLYQLSKGDILLTAEDYLTGESVGIALDARLTPAQNAQKYYAAYRKLDSAEKMLVKLIADGERELIYIDSVFDAAGRAGGEAELNEIRRELAETGYLRKVKSFDKNAKKEKPPKPLPFMRFTASDGTEILIGRNNRQNDELTLKTAKPDDIWLHAKDIAGSHVILRCSGKPADEQALTEAAAIAAYCSKARESGRVPVDYTPARYVKKPAGAKPGMVIFTNNKTLYVTPSDELYNSLKNTEGR